MNVIADRNATDEGVTEYVYDINGARLKRIEHTSGGDVETIFVSDKANRTGYAQVIEEKATPTADPTVTSVVGGDVIGQARSAASDALEYLLYDGHGSTRALLDAAGAVVTGSSANDQLFDYDAFGVSLPGGPASVLTTLLYSGEQYDSGLKQQYLRARYYDQAVGRFSSFDDFEGGVASPSTLHKFTYASGNPASFRDPTGHFSVSNLVATVGIGALLGGLTTVAVNYSLGRPLSSGVGWGMLFGGIAGPLAAMFPLLGAGLAGYGISQSWELTWQVWTNPRSTKGQMAASLVLFGGSLFGGYVAGKNVLQNGWYNPIFETPPLNAPPALTRSSPLSEVFENVPDNTLVHNSPYPLAELATGVRTGLDGKSSWFRWGDVKHLTVEQYRSAVGELAAGGRPDANTFVFKLMNDTK